MAGDKKTSGEEGPPDGEEPKRGREPLLRDLLDDQTLLSERASTFFKTSFNLSLATGPDLVNIWLRNARWMHTNALQVIEHAVRRSGQPQLDVSKIVNHIFSMVDLLTLIVRHRALGNRLAEKQVIKDLEILIDSLPHAVGEYMGQVAKDTILQHRRHLAVNLAIGYKAMKATAGSKRRGGLERTLGLVEPYRQFWIAAASGAPVDLGLREPSPDDRIILGILDYISTIWEEHVSMATVAGIVGLKWPSPLGEQALELLWKRGLGPKRTAERIAFFSIDKEPRRARNGRIEPSCQGELDALTAHAAHTDLLADFHAEITHQVLGLADGLPAGNTYLRAVENPNRWSIPDSLTQLPATGPGAWVARRFSPRLVTAKDGSQHKSHWTQNGDILIKPVKKSDHQP